ncbi:DNA topoisomerase, partial [Desulfotruncus alcoholivorax]|uniref:DNA topoisomerase n=1 Tax=Desulfotruncus alcoholivorax TaxID=265477 RepID=UPI0004827A23
MPNKNLIIAEKPSVARDLAAVLGNFQKKEGYLENNEYVVTWAIGHLVELAEPEDYDAQLKKWDLNTLPVIPERFKLKTSPKTVKQFKVVKQLVNRSDIEKLICATDAGREGELIFRYIYRLTGCKKPFMRLWLSETTPAAVKKGFAALRPGSEFNRLAAAAEARSQADWLIGINATRSFTVRHSTLLSIGRVQTPTLALIVNREREIKNFVPEPYWELYAEFTKSDGQVYAGRWFNGEQNRFHNLQTAQVVQARVNNQPASVLEVEEKDLAELPPLLFNLNDLQKEANKKFGLAAAKTLELAQSLYETRKLITYPRT